MEAVDGLLAKLAADGDFQDDLHQPQVRLAMKHWTGENRLPPEQAEKLMGDFRVLAVLDKIKALQTACQRAGLPVPLDKVLRRETSLGMPLSAPPASSPSSSTSTSTPSSSMKATTPRQANEDKKVTATRRRKATAPATAPPPIAPTAPVQRVQVPETLPGWVRLLSPLLIIGLVLMYAFASCL